MSAVTTVGVSQHATDKAVERFRVNKADAAEWIRSNFKKAQFVANITGDDGKPCRLYAFQRIAFVVASDADFVITVYSQHTATEGITVKIRSMLKRELSAAERAERTEERRVRVEKAKLAVEIAQCRLKMEITPSKSVIRTNTARIAQIDAELAKLDAELLAAKRSKTSVAKSVAAYM